MVNDPTDTGLSSAEAAIRLKQYGANEVKPIRQRSVLMQFLAHFYNPLVLVLLIAITISALNGDEISALIIGVIILMSVTLDFIQEYRAGQSAAKLAAQVAVTATVLRDGKSSEIPVTQLVPGDIVSLSAGDLIPADGQLLEAKDLFVNQSQLTGEPYPVEKYAGTSANPDPCDVEAKSAVFMGSTVISGSARMCIARTGQATALGQIAVSLEKKPPPTAF
ncbi:MAG: HAD-IC family P-type ATPase, partial [Betaproteobacteria bacterium]|nr:HAD-IC family P-type ATPase [Betaproteobacteria bacterium]